MYVSDDSCNLNTNLPGGGEKRKRSICTFCVSISKRDREGNEARDLLKRQSEGPVDGYLDLKPYFAGYPPISLESHHLVNMEESGTNGGLLLFNHSLPVI